MTHDEILEAAIERWGMDAQCTMAIEEASELIQAITHYWRGRTDHVHVAEEVADMTIMCRQLRKMFDPDTVDNIIDEKMKRLEKRVTDKKYLTIG